MKKKCMVFLLALGVFFLCQRLAMAWENVVIETSNDSAQASLDRVAGPDHRGFSSSSQSYESDSPSSAASPGGLSF